MIEIVSFSAEPTASLKEYAVLTEPCKICGAKPGKECEDTHLRDGFCHMPRFTAAHNHLLEKLNECAQQLYSDAAAGIERPRAHQFGGPCRLCKWLVEREGWTVNDVYADHLDNS